MDGLDAYNQIRAGGAGYFENKRGLIAVWGSEAVQFLDGLISNDVKTLEDGQQMLAAFPNAQGRLLAVVRAKRLGDRYLLETEYVTREKVFQNLFRFTFAGDFFVEDVTDKYRYFELYGAADVRDAPTGFSFTSRGSSGYFVPISEAELFVENLDSRAAVKIPPNVYETLRIENGVPRYDVDMDEMTIVPELGQDDLISYKKGCYIGQEIIARIHFRGHVAKRLAGLLVSEPGAVATGILPGTEIATSEGKSAGRLTSVTHSPQLDRMIALAYVRYDHLAHGTELVAGDADVRVHDLPFLA